MAVTEGRTVLLERFLRLRIPMFFGEYDLDKAESWTHELEHTFETMECAEEDQFFVLVVLVLRWCLPVHAGDVLVLLEARRKWPFRREGPNGSALLVEHAPLRLWYVCTVFWGGLRKDCTGTPLG
ncbi:hypothetical protein Taro_038966 [Colocasia esculenta]|uniref:Uncharacterized protein n=1 Tax=Colocasia esculenta TaxID=4460 RepID=A0A843WEC5_COLES|nr:hypothetical protein [Colocasia esculenta]